MVVGVSEEPARAALRAAEAHVAGDRNGCAAQVRWLAAELDGPYFSFLRAVRSTVDDLVPAGVEGLGDAEMAEAVAAEAIHRMVFARSELLSRRLLVDGSAIDGYETRSQAARVLGPAEVVPAGWTLLEQSMTGTDDQTRTVYVAFDAERAAQPLVALKPLPPELLGRLYEHGVLRAAGDRHCRVFAAPVGGPLSQQPDASLSTTPATPGRGLSLVPDIDLV